MYKKIGLLIVAMVLFVGASDVQRPTFSKYKTVEGYEVRPGILAMPRYSADGQVCQISIERIHYRPGAAVSPTHLSRDEVREIFDEVVPADQRGAKPTNVLEQGGISIEGNATLEDEQYENVVLHIYGHFWAYPQAKKQKYESQKFLDSYVAVITWKKRKCAELK